MKLKLVEAQKNNTLIKLDTDVFALNKNQIINLCDNNHILLNDGGIFGFYFKKSIYFSNDLEGSLNFFNIKKSITGVLKNDLFSITNLLITDKFAYINGSNGVYRINEYNEIEKWNFEGRKPKFIIGFREIYVTNKISCKLTNKKIEDWIFKFENIIEIPNAKKYGNTIVYENKIFFFLFDSSRKTDINATFCLDIETGKELWRNNNIGGYLTTFKNKIYNLHIKTVKILNPNTFEIETIDLTEQLNVLDKTQYDKANDYTWDIPFRFSVNKYVIDNEYLYFSQDKRNTIGIINLTTHQLEWHTDIEIDNPDIQIITDIKVNNNRLYVQDSGNTLHIFEKQKRLGNTV